MTFRKIMAVGSAAIMLCSLLLMGGMVSAACNHIYDHDYDADCNVCGATRSVTVPITYGGSSISEDVHGVAFKFDATVAGMAVKQDGYTAIYTNAKLGKYKVVKMGAIASNGYSSTDIEAKRLYTLNGDNLSFVVRIIRIPEKHFSSVITATPYIIIESNGVQYTIYGKKQYGVYRVNNDNWTPIG